MNTLHLMLGGLSVVLLVVAAGGDHDEQVPAPHRVLDLVVGGALVVGNAVSLLPGAPAWYSASVAALSVAALTWTALRLVGRSTPPLAVVRPGVITPTPSRRARSLVAPLYAAPGTQPVDADVVETPDVAFLADRRPRRVVTADDLHAAGPPGSRTTVGQGVYVAAGLADYVDPRRGRRGRRRHGATVTDDESARRLRVLRAYGATAPLRGRIRNERA